MCALRQTIWCNIWKYTVGKSQEHQLKEERLLTMCSAPGHLQYGSLWHVLQADISDFSHRLLGTPFLSARQQFSWTVVFSQQYTVYAWIEHKNKYWTIDLLNYRFETYESKTVRLNLRRYRGIQKIWKSYRWTRICKFSRQKCRIYKFSRQKLCFWTTWQKPSVWL